jgi:hypothetical protein
MNDGEGYILGRKYFKNPEKSFGGIKKVITFAAP